MLFYELILIHYRCSLSVFPFPFVDVPFQGNKASSQVRSWLVISLLPPLSLDIHLPTLGDDYKLLHSLGEGAYGTVVAALHKPSGRQVAIKKVLPFEHTLFCLRTLRELKLLRFFSETCVNENVSFAFYLAPTTFPDNRYIDRLDPEYHQTTFI